MGVGVGIGIAIGAAVGAAMRNEAMEVALGTAFGVVSRCSFDIQERQERLTRQLVIRWLSSFLLDVWAAD